MQKKLRFQVLGEYLKQKRIAAGLTQGYVSQELGYSSPQFISNFERGICAPPLSTIRVIVGLYKIPVNTVIKILLAEQGRYMKDYLSTSSSKRVFSKKAAKKNS